MTSLGEGTKGLSCFEWMDIHGIWHCYVEGTCVPQPMRPKPVGVTQVVSRFEAVNASLRQDADEGLWLVFDSGEWVTLEKGSGGTLFLTDCSGTETTLDNYLAGIQSAMVRETTASWKEAGVAASLPK